MPSPRTCSHVKINGLKCGSPALKYHTLCYFHYQWRHRRANPYHYDRKEGWTTMTLPPLESKASILFAICEIQQSLLDGSIDFRTAKALFYGIQLAIQLRATDDDLGAKETPNTCHELTDELEKARWRHQRPPQVVCDSCTRAVACLDATNCHHTKDDIRALERLHEPERYARQLKDEEYEKEQERKNQELWDKKLAEDKAYNEERAAAAAPPLPQSTNVASSTPASSSTPADTTPTLHSCHPERSAAVPREAEGPFVSSTKATNPNPTMTEAHRADHSQPVTPVAGKQMTENLQSRRDDCELRSSDRKLGVPDERSSLGRKLFRSPAQFSRLLDRARAGVPGERSSLGWL